MAGINENKIPKCITIGGESYYSEEVLLEFADYCFEQYSDQDKSLEEFFKFWIDEKIKKK